MKHVTGPFLLALAVAVFPALGDAKVLIAPCKPGRYDSNPSSLGADGWAAVDGPVTGGCGAAPTRIFDVYNRAQLVDALTRQVGNALPEVPGRPSDTPKIVYVHGTIDLNVDDDNQPLREEDYMRGCGWTEHATYYDPVTHDQTGAGGFFGAYKAAYDPNLWIRQSLDPADNRPPRLSGPLEEARMCFQRMQAERVVVDVGSNTSIIGAGSDAKIVNGNLRLGFINQDDPEDLAAYRAENIVIRNITFADAFDMFSAWDPKDSFSITITNTNGCQAIFDAATDSGPHRCTVRGGRWNSEYDSISVMNAERVWVDHNTFTDEPRIDKLYPPTFDAPFNESTQKVQHHDGQVDVTLLGTKVTISSNVFRRHDKTNLLGGSDFAGIVDGYGPGRIDVTFHDNYFFDTVQRMPRVRFGRVHVFNNYYQVERNQNIPGTTTPVDYRVTDAWILGTASKLVTEHNLFDITNNSLTPPRIINYSSTLANRQFCIDTGFTAAACGTYYRDEGTIIKMIRTTVTPNTTATVLYDAFQAALGVQQANAGAAPLLALDPADPGVFWLPSHSYPYVAARIDTSAQQEMLRQRVRNSAGAGKL